MLRYPVVGRSLLRLRFLEDSKLFSLFQISWTNWIEIEHAFLKIYRMQPSELDMLPFYRIEYLIEKIKEDNENDEKQRDSDKKSQATHQQSFDKQQGQMQSQMKNMSKGLPSVKMPNFNSFKL